MPRRSGRAVAVRATQTALDCSPKTVVVLTALLYSLFHHTLSSDVIFLSLLRAKDEALKMGVSEQEFEQIKKVLVENWAKQRNANPLSCMF